jgi:hypothetical protein
MYHLRRDIYMRCATGSVLILLLIFNLVEIGR